MKKLVKVIIVIGIIVLIALIAVGIFAYRNMNYDYLNESFLKKKGYKLSFTENFAKSDDGSEIYYIERPNNAPKLLLLHGQQVNCYDYAKVLPELSKHFHIFALDYYGHGNSSKNPAKYNAVEIGNDIVWFIENVIKDKVYISGHSSGALLAAYVSAKAPDYIIATVLEDGPFFSTLPTKAGKTIAWLEFKNMYEYLNQNEIGSFMEYSLEHNYMREVINTISPQAWDKVIKEPALKYLDKHPGEIPKIWYFPPKLGINSIYALNANMQDGNGKYDLRFGVTFYDFSWFEGFDTEEILSNIQSPTVVMHVAPNEATAPEYYDKNGVLLAAMDEKDAQKVVDLVPKSKYVGGFKSYHNIHADLPDEYIQVLLNLKAQMEGQATK
ncbi:MAG: alpha/beta hydrolase [Lentimicrobiaceae bacterium]|nr:alpha/beta hydrolase [Lentimicrobiaceae bacterium]